jgi:hypothetical protein
MTAKKRRRARQRRASRDRLRSDPTGQESYVEDVDEGEPDESIVGNGQGDARQGRSPGPLRAAASAATSRRGGFLRGGRAPARRTARSQRPSPRARGPQEPQPPILFPIARSFVLVGSSPLILVTAFVSVLATWAIYSSSGIIRIASPATMAQIQALLPLQSLLDLQFMFAALRAFSPPAAIGVSALLILIRSAFVALLLSLIVEALAGRVQPEPWRERLRIAGRRAYSVFQFVFALEAGVLVAVYALSSILGAFFGALGLVLALILGMYLLVLSPIVATTERLGATAAVRLSVRAGRLRGPQNLSFAFVYVFATLYVVLGLRGSAAAQATPSILVWLYVLLATFVHVSLLAALTYRWLLVRTVVGADEERERLPRARTASRRRG